MMPTLNWFSASPFICLLWSTRSKAAGRVQTRKKRNKETVEKQNGIYFRLKVGV